MRALSPTVRATSGDARRTGALRRPCRTHPWVARSPRGIGLSRALAAADEADGEVGGTELRPRRRENGVRERSVGKWAMLWCR